MSLSRVRDDDLLVGFDGTWAEDMVQHDTDNTNVGWLCRNWPGFVHYESGLGRRGGIFGKWIGGLFGVGIRGRIKDVTTSIRLFHHSHPNSRIVLTGWSRGAVGCIWVANEIPEIDLELYLFDPVPGPIHPGWKLHNPPHRVHVIYAMDNKNPLFRPTRIEGVNVTALDMKGSHRDIGTQFPALRIMRLWMLRRGFRLPKVPRR